MELKTWLGYNGTMAPMWNGCTGENAAYYNALVCTYVGGLCYAIAFFEIVPLEAY